MANTNRRYIDRNGNMFIPMNVEGGSWNEHFITTPKLVCMALIICAAFFIGLTLKEAWSPLSSYLIFYGMWAVISSYVIRFIIFEEKFYYRMYNQLKEKEVTTPAIFWDIASIRDGMDGAVLTYSDAKIGVIIRIERDTITGKHSEFKETHYDAISDFYREIILNKYNFVQMNIMEQAGNDPRLEELDKLIYKDDNPNIRELMERQIGYIKNVTHHTLYESDYVLFYTNDLSKIDTIVNDAIDIVYKILDGAYIGYRVLRARDIIEFVKEDYDVKYFSYTEATLSMFKSHGVNTKNPFDLSQIVYTDGDIQNITQRELYKINKLTSDINEGTIDLSKISIKETLYPIEIQNKNKKVEFETLSDGFEAKADSVNRQSRQAKTGKRLTFGKQQKGKVDDIAEQDNTDNQLYVNNDMFDEFDVGKQNDNEIDIRNSGLDDDDFIDI